MNLINGWINNKAIDEIEDNILNAEPVYFADAISRLIKGIKIAGKYPSDDEVTRVQNALAKKLQQVAKHLQETT